MNSSSFLTIVLIILIVTAALLGYRFFWQSPNPTAVEPTSGLVAVGLSRADARLQTDQFLAVLRDLEGVTLDPTILSDPRFTALVDITKPLTPKPIGRNNPFAPISASDYTSSTSSRSQSPAARSTSTRSTASTTLRSTSSNDIRSALSNLF